MKAEDIKELMGQIGPVKKNLGQHFLTNDVVVEEMVDAAEITNKDSILEIGPGLGILTRKIVASPAREIILVEKDRKLSEWLFHNIKKRGLKIINKDALMIIPSLEISPPLKVISNLPYNISSPVIISLLTVCPTLPEKMILMVQKEVAKRLVASPDDSDRGILTVFLELFGKTKIIKNIPPNFFYPPPKVDSAVIEISDITAPDFDKKKAFKIIKLGFSQKRKKIKNSLFSSLNIDQVTSSEICKNAKIDLNDRPEDLSKDQWQSLIKDILARQLI